MIELVLAAEDIDAIRSALIGGEDEGCAVLFASQTLRADTTIRLLVREAQFPKKDDYTKRGAIEAELSPDFVAKVSKRARREKLAIIFVHSHPGSEPPHFSAIDAAGEKHLVAFLALRNPELVHAALVVSSGGMRARRLGTEEELRVIAIGMHRDVIFDPMLTSSPDSEIFDRQVRAFGASGLSGRPDQDGIEYGLPSR